MLVRKPLPRALCNIYQIKIDYSTHRGHGHLVAKGGEFKPMFAELLADQLDIAGEGRKYAHF